MKDTKFTRRTLFVFSLLLILILSGVAYSGFTSRITTWNSNQTLTAAALNAEFDNILDNGVGLTASQTLTNKTLTSPIINGGVSGTAILDEDDMATDSATSLASQQSIKAYVDNNRGDIQSLYVSRGDTTSSGTTIPYDDTVPTSSEGFLVLSSTITPTNASNKLTIEALTQVGNSNAGGTKSTMALFKNVSSAAMAVSSHETVEKQIVPIPMKYQMTAGTTSPIKFKIRIGSATGTTYLNGDTTGRKFGGTANSYLMITEHQ